MRKSQYIAYLLTCFIFGILARSLFSLPIFPLFILILSLIIAGAALWPKISWQWPLTHKRQIVSALLGGSVFLFLGAGRVEAFLPVIDDKHIAAYNGQLVKIIGEVAAEPDERETSTRYRLKVAGLEGRLLLLAPVYPAYAYGDVLQFDCRLQSPERIRGFNYPGLLAQYRVYSLCFEPANLQRLTTRNYPLTRFPGWQQRLLVLKSKFERLIGQSLSYPASSFLSATLLGRQRELPEKIRTDFSVTGTSHIMAVSGMHIVILSNIIFHSFRRLRLTKKKAFIGVVLLLVLFTGLVGFLASAIRAVIFGLVNIAAQILGRPKRALNLLLFAAAILLAINPLLLVHDIGYQLSFLAVLGLIYLGPLFKHWLRFVPTDFDLREMLTMTFSAQIFVLPWLLYKFGNLSLIAPLANIVVLPVIPLLMGLGFGLLLFGLIFLPLAQILGWLLWVIVSYVLVIVSVLARVPFGHWQTPLPLWGTVLMYALLAVLLQKKISDKIWPFFKTHFPIRKPGGQGGTESSKVKTEEFDLDTEGLNSFMKSS